MANAIKMNLSKPEGIYDPTQSRFFGAPAIPLWMEEQIEEDEVFLAQIRLADPTDKETWQKTYDLLKWMRDEGIYGISEVYTTEEINEKEHLSGEFSFVIESDGYTSFAEDWKRPMVKQLDLSDYRYGKATHGHNPDKGPQPIFFGFGKDIKEGVLIERRPTVDEAPTYAKILGVEMPGVDGAPITEMLK